VIHIYLGEGLNNIQSNTGWDIETNHTKTGENIARRVLLRWVDTFDGKI
jgi:hypothetical protein